MESPTTPTLQSSNTPLQISKSHFLQDLKTLEEPLVGLLAKPLEECTDEELRDFVQRQRALRESRQSFKAAVVAQQEGKDVETKAAKAVKLFDEF